MSGYHQGLKQYRTLDLQTRIEDASPHELINMLLQGACSHINAASQHLQNHRVKEKGEHISKAISIMSGLRSSLDHDNGGQIAENLDKLYEYVEQILLQANIDNNNELLIEANALLSEIYQAWQEIKPGTVSNSSV